MAIEPVCKNCKKRNPGCHTICKDYICFKEELEAFNEKVKKEKEKTYFTASWSNSKRKRICGR